MKGLEIDHQNTLIKPALTKDIPYLLELEKQCFNPTEQFDYQQFYYLINKGAGHFYVWSPYFTIYGGYVYVTKTGRLYSIAVHPAYRKSGIGSLLIDVVEKECMHLKCIRLEVRADNNYAIRFYKKHGYKQYGIKHNYYLDGIDAILMKKDLHNAKG